ncbi:GtrA family protein [Sulfobacillus thermosulfidooxidans]
MTKYSIHVNSQITKRLWKYSVTGAISAACAWTSSVLLFHFLSINFIVSQALGFIVGIIVNYPLSRQWTFRNRYPRIVRQFWIFALIAGIGLGINELSLYIFVGMCHWSVPLGMLIGLGVAFIWNFSLNNFITFGLLKD